MPSRQLPLAYASMHGQLQGVSSACTKASAVGELLCASSKLTPQTRICCAAVLRLLAGLVGLGGVRWMQEC